MLNGLDSEYEFSAEAKSFNIYAIKVTHLDETVGIYFLKEHDLHFTVLNLYYNEKNKESVFQSIIDHLIHLKSLSVKTFDYDLIQYFNQIGGTSLNRKNRKENVALTTPAFFNFDKSFKIQGGDGDMFC